MLNDFFKLNTPFEAFVSEKISILIISLISGSALFFLIIVVDITDTPGSPTSGLGLVGWYIGYFIWGYFFLFLLSDYRLKAKQKEGS